MGPVKKDLRHRVASRFTAGPVYADGFVILLPVSFPVIKGNCSYICRSLIKKYHILCLAAFRLESFIIFFRPTESLFISVFANESGSESRTLL